MQCMRIREWEAAQAAKAQAEAEAQARARARAQQNRSKIDVPIQYIVDDNRVINNTLNVKNLNIVGREQQQGQQSFGQSQRSRSVASSSPSAPATPANIKPSEYLTDVSGDGGAWGLGETRCQDPPGTPKASREVAEQGVHMRACNSGWEMNDGWSNADPESDEHLVGMEVGARSRERNMYLVWARRAVLVFDSGRRVVGFESTVSTFVLHSVSAQLRSNKFYWMRIRRCHARYHIRKSEPPSVAKHTISRRVNTSLTKSLRRVQIFGNSLVVCRE